MASEANTPVMYISKSLLETAGLAVAGGRMSTTQAKIILENQGALQPTPGYVKISAAELATLLNESAEQHKKFQQDDGNTKLYGLIAGVAMVAGGTVVMVAAGPAVLGYAAMSAGIAGALGVIAGGATVTLVSLHSDLRATFNGGLKAVIKKLDKMPLSDLAKLGLGKA